MYPELLKQHAVFSTDGAYRYWLRRKVGDCVLPRPLLWVMLNPSLATATKDDPTTRVVCNYARRWGYHTHCAVNLFAAVTPHPREMKKLKQAAVGPQNNSFITTAIKWVGKEGGTVVAAWGRHGSFLGRDEEVRALLRTSGAPVFRIGVNKDGSPRFPLAVPADVKLEEWTDL